MLHDFREVVDAVERLEERPTERQGRGGRNMPRLAGWNNRLQFARRARGLRPGLSPERVHNQRACLALCHLGIHPLESRSHSGRLGAGGNAR